MLSRADRRAITGAILVLSCAVGQGILKKYDAPLYDHVSLTGLTLLFGVLALVKNAENSKGSDSS